MRVRALIRHEEVKPSSTTSIDIGQFSSSIRHELTVKRKRYTHSSLRPTTGTQPPRFSG